MLYLQSKYINIKTIAITAVVYRDSFYAIFEIWSSLFFEYDI